MSTGGIELLHFALTAILVSVVPAGMPAVPSGWSAGIYVGETDSGEPLIEMDVDSIFRPASTVKLVTTWLALDILGPSYVYETALVADTVGGVLYLVGAGAPLLSSEHVEIMALETAAALPQGSTWELRWDTARFQEESHCPGWDESDWSRTYCPPVEGLSIGDNIVQIILSTVGGEIRIFTYPDLPGLEVRDSLTFGRETSIRTEIGGWDSGPPVITLKGTIADESRVILFRPFPGPPSELTGMLADALERTGLIVPRVGQGVLPQDSGLVTVSVMRSDPLFVLLTSMNKWSRNMVAEMILRTVSLEEGGPPASTGAACDAAGVAIELLAGGVPGLRIADGSGLSRLNGLAPRHLAAVIEDGAGSHEWGVEFLATLPVNGIDGTLRSRLGNLPPGSFRGKTGTLNDTSCIAGLLRTSTERELTVVIMLEVPSGYTWTARAWQDSLITWLYETY